VECGGLTPLSVQSKAGANSRTPKRTEYQVDGNQVRGGDLSMSGRGPRRSAAFAFVRSGESSPLMVRAERPRRLLFVAPPGSA
jgi:hypothetical protein